MVGSVKADSWDLAVQTACVMLCHADAPERGRASIASRAQHGVRGRVASGLHGERMRCMASS